MKRAINRLVSFLTTILMLFNIIVPESALAGVSATQQNRGTLLGKYETGVYSPGYILGDAVSYGMVAGTINLSSHTETNFAVKKFNNGDNAMELGAASDDPIPYIVGEINGKLRFSGEQKVPVDLFIAANQESKIQNDNQNNKAINKIYLEQNYTPGGAIDSKVNSIVNSARQKSNTFFNKTATITPKRGEKEINTIAYPNDAVIYVDCTNFDQISNGGWKIKKREGQQIIFNMPTTGEARVAQYFTTIYDSNGNNIIESEFASNTSGKDPNLSNAQNKKITKYLFEKIVFNAPNATRFYCADTAGIFLCPSATSASYNNGAGWLVINENGTINAGAEWHFYWKNRHYTSVGDTAIQLKKKIRHQESGQDLPYIQGDYEFKLYQVPNKNQPNANKKLIQTVKADKDGLVAFKKIYYNQNDVGQQPKDFYYIIEETIPNPNPNNGIKYLNNPVKFRVHAVDLGHNNIKTTVYAGWDGNTEIKQGSNGVIPLGDYYNEKIQDKGNLKIKKILTINGNNAQGHPAANDTYFFTVTGSGDAADVTKTVKIQINNGYVTKGWVDNQEVTINSEGELEIKDLPVGKYTVKELLTPAQQQMGIRITDPASGSREVNVVKNGSGATIALATFTNDYSETEATVKKVWDDANNQDGIRPASLTVVLSNGTEVTLNEENGWEYTVGYLQKYSNGQEIEYTWSEKDIPDGYVLSGNSKNGTITTLTNSHTTEKTSVSVTKVWEDNNNKDGYPPAWRCR